MKLLILFVQGHKSVLSDHICFCFRLEDDDEIQFSLINFTCQTALLPSYPKTKKILGDKHFEDGIWFIKSLSLTQIAYYKKCNFISKFCTHGASYLHIKCGLIRFRNNCIMATKKFFATNVEDRFQYKYYK